MRTTNCGAMRYALHRLGATTANDSRRGILIG